MPPAITGQTISRLGPFVLARAVSGARGCRCSSPAVAGRGTEVCSQRSFPHQRPRTCAASRGGHHDACSLRGGDDAIHDEARDFCGNWEETHVIRAADSMVMCALNVNFNVVGVIAVIFDRKTRLASNLFVRFLDRSFLARRSPSGLSVRTLFSPER